MALPSCGSLHFFGAGWSSCFVLSLFIFPGSLRRLRGSVAQSDYISLAYFWSETLTHLRGFELASLEMVIGYGEGRSFWSSNMWWGIWGGGRVWLDDGSRRIENSHQH
jgi:hypothetical protein